MNVVESGSTRSRGFTLIELLVVIAIIAILAAILFPVFAKVREKARQTACLSNEKQLGLGLIQYQQDFDECMPSGGDWHDTGSGWAGQIFPYVKSTGVFVCPDDTSTIQSVVSYGYNADAVMSTNPSVFFQPPVGLALSQFASPSQTVMFFETAQCGATTPNAFNLSGPQFITGADITPNGNNGYVGESPAGNGLGGSDNPTSYNYNYSISQQTLYATGYFNTPGYSPTPSAFTGPTGRHTDGSNYVMCDGHAKWLRGAAVSAGLTNTTVPAGFCGISGYAARTDCPTIAATFNYQ